MLCYVSSENAGSQEKMPLPKCRWRYFVLPAFINTQCRNENTAVVKQRTIDLLVFIYVCYGERAFIALLSVDKELSVYLTTLIQFRRHECTKKAVVCNCGVVYSTLRWLFSPGK